MAILTIDLSGRSGLAQTFAGDLNDTSAAPNKRYLGSDGQMADGIFNPFRLDGYLSPANNKYADLTGTINDEIIAKEYSSSNDTVYLAQNGTRLSELSGLDDTSVSSSVVLPGQSAFRDIEMYEMNGTEALLYTYLYADSSENSRSSLYLGFKSIDPDKGIHQIESTVFESLGEDTSANQTITSTTNSGLSQKFRTQDFNTSGNYDVTGIRVALNMPFVGTTQTWTLRIGIQTDSAGVPSGTYVTNASVDIAASTLPVGYYDYVYATFASTITLTADTTYHIVVEPVTYGDLGANEGVYWLSSFDGSSLYTTGEIYKEEDATWIQASFDSESFDFALVLNQYNYIGSTERTSLTDGGSISIGTAANGHNASSTSVSATQATTGLLKPLIVAGVFNGSGSDSITGVTCDGNAMTFGSKIAIGTGGKYIYIYYAVGMAEGSHTITATASGSTALTILTTAYYGVDQTTPMFFNSSNTGGSNETSLNFSNSGFPPDMPVLPYVLGGSVNTNGNSGTIIDSPYVERSESASNQFMKWFDYDDVLKDPSAISTTIRTASGTGTRLAAIYGWIRGAVGTETTEIFPPIVEEDGVSFLQKADNGSMYWFTNNRVHKFNGGETGGATGTLAIDQLTFPDYITCIDAVDTNSIMYIAVQSTETASPDYRTFNGNVLGVYLWNRTSTASTMRDFIPVYGARSIKRIFVTPSGAIRLITIGEDKFTEVRGLVDGKFAVLYRLGLNAYPNRRDAVDYINNVVIWLGADGVIYALGAPAGGKESVFKIGNINGELAGALTSGIIATGNDNNAAASQQGVYITWLDGTTKVASKWYPHGTGTISSVAQTGNQGDVYTLNKFLPMLSDLKSVDIVCLPFGAADDTTTVATVKFYVNQSTTPWKTKTITRHEISKGYVAVELNKPYVTSVQMEIEWSTSQTLGTNDFIPVYALFDYEGTGTRG